MPALRGAIQAYLKRETPQQIFIEAGFQLSIIGNRKPNECLKRWRAAYSALGESGPLEERRDKGAKGRKPAEDLSMEEQLKRAEARIQLFEAGNDFNRGNIHFYNSERYQWELEKMIPDEYRNHLLVV